MKKEATQEKKTCKVSSAHTAFVTKGIYHVNKIQSFTRANVSFDIISTFIMFEVFKYPQ